MRWLLDRRLVLTGAGIAISALWILIGAIEWVDRSFPGFLLLENGVVASAGLASWPATANGEIFQHHLLSYDGKPFTSAAAFGSYIESLASGTLVEYEFSQAGEIIRRQFSTRTFTATDGILLFGATFVSAIALLGVALALRYMAPLAPASFGCALSLGISGIWALSAVDLYGPYHFFRVHAFAECMLAAGSVHMALVFPHERSIVKRTRSLIPLTYAISIGLGIVSTTYLYNPSVYTITHRSAVALAGLAFAILVTSQVQAYIRPVSLEARQRVTVLALGTFASITPGIVIFGLGTLTGGKAAENLAGWAGPLFPLAVGYAVLRADLLEVDAILRRTVNYVLVTIIVGLSYAILIGGFETAFTGRTNLPRWVSILAFSCFCTFALLPLRNLIQRAVDRIFFRSVYDFRVTVRETSTRMARLIDLASIKHEIQNAVITALQPESVEISIYPDSTEPTSEPNLPTDASAGIGEIHDLDSGGIAVSFRSHNRIVALLSLGRRMSGRFYSGEDRALLQVLANQGAIAIENALAIERLRDLNRNLEKRVHDRTAELAATLQELTDTQDQLVQAERLAAVGELAAGVAHEVNNPLNFARNSLRTLGVLVDELSAYSSAISKLDFSNTDRLQLGISEMQDQFDRTNAAELASDVQQLIEILGSGLDRTARLVADLRDFASPRKQQMGEFSLTDTVNEAINLARSTADDVGAEIENLISSEETIHEGNQSGLTQVLLNVLKNAIDSVSSRDGGKVSIESEFDSQAGIHRLTVEDNGTGIPPEIAERAFEPFFTTKEAGKGTGLGLSMCKRVMHEQGGEILIDSTVKSGARIVIEIPDFSRNTD